MFNEPYLYWSGSNRPLWVEEPTNPGNIITHAFITKGEINNCRFRNTLTMDHATHVYIA